MGLCMPQYKCVYMCVRVCVFSPWSCKIIWNTGRSVLTCLEKGRKKCRQTLEIIAPRSFGASNIDFQIFWFNTDESWKSVEMARITGGREMHQRSTIKSKFLPCLSVAKTLFNLDLESDLESDLLRTVERPRRNPNMKERTGRVRCC